MPCNPAIGGTAKGHLVREIDALGGVMGRAIDATGIQFKLLNRSRGPAVWSPRAQADKRLYSSWVADEIGRHPNIEWVFDRAGQVLVDGGRIVGVSTEDGRRPDVSGAGRHDRHVSERSDPCRRRAAAGGASRRTAVPRARRVDPVSRFLDGPTQDRDAAETAPRQHRLRRAASSSAVRRRARRRRAGAVLVRDDRSRFGIARAAGCSTQTIASAIW